MMIKNFYQLLQIILKQKAKTHVKRQKSKLLIYDIYLKKYVPADQLLTPSPVKDSIEGTGSWEKSKDFILFDLLLKKFVNPKLDLLLPTGVNIKTNIWHCNTLQGCRYASTSKDFWRRGSGNYTEHGPALPSTSTVGAVMGWAGQVLNKPESNPRPEHSTASLTIEQGGNPDNNRRKTQNGRRDTENKKSNKYGRNSSRNGALLYEGKSERKKRSILAKSFKPEKNVTLLTKSTRDNKKIVVQQQKGEKETLFKKICSQIFTFRKFGGNDREEILNKGPNLKKKPIVIKGGKTPSETNNPQKSVIKNNTFDSKLAKNNQEHQKVSQTVNSSISEWSIVEINTSNNKLDKNTKKHYKDTHSLIISQNEKLSANNKTSEGKFSKGEKEHKKDPHSLSSSKSEKFVTENIAPQNKVAKNIKEHHKHTQSVTTSQNGNPIVQTKYSERNLPKGVNGHNKVTHSLSSSKSENSDVENNTSENKAGKNIKDTQSVTNSQNEKPIVKNKTLESNLTKEVKVHNKVNNNLLSSKSKQSVVENNTSKSMLSMNIKDNQSVANSQNEKPIVKNKTLESNLTKEVKEHNKKTNNLSSSESELPVVENNISQNKVAKNIKEHHKGVQSVVTSQNENPIAQTKYSERNLAKGVNEHNKVTHSLSSSKSENSVVEKNTSENNVGKNIKDTQSITNSQNENPIVKNKPLESNLTKEVKEDSKVNNNLLSSKCEQSVVENNTSESMLSMNVKDNQSVTNSQNENPIVKNKTLESNLTKEVKEHNKVTHNLSSSAESELSVVENNITENKLSKDIKVNKSVTNSQTEKLTIKNKMLDSNLPKGVKEHNKVTHNLSSSKSEQYFVENNTSEKTLAKKKNVHHKDTQSLTITQKENPNVKLISSESNLPENVKEYHKDKVTQNLSSSKSEAFILKNSTSESKLAKSDKENHKVIQDFLISDNENIVGISKSKLANSNKEHHEDTLNLLNSEIEKNSAQNNTSEHKLVNSVKEDDEVKQNLASSMNVEITNKNANNTNRNCNKIETTIRELLVVKDTAVNFKNEAPPEKLEKENLNVVDTSENDSRQNSLSVINVSNETDIDIKNDEVDSEKNNNEIVITNENNTIKEKVNTLAKNTSDLENNLANLHENIFQKKCQLANIKCLENLSSNFISSPIKLKSEDILKSNDKINPENKSETCTLNKATNPEKVIKSKHEKEGQLAFNVNTGQVSSLTKSTEFKISGNIPNVAICAKVNPSTNTAKQLKNQSATSCLSKFNKLIMSNLNSSKVQNKTQNTTPQTLQKGTLDGKNAVLSGFENNAKNTKAYSVSQKKVVTKVNDKKEVNTMKNHNVEPKSAEKLHEISAQGKFLEDFALDGDLNQYNVVNYKGFKVANSNSDTQVTMKTLPELHTIKEGWGRSNSQLKCTDKSLENPTTLQNSTELKKSAAHGFQENLPKNNLPEQSTLKERLGKSSSLSKSTDKSLEKPAAIQKSAKLNNGALLKNQVKNNNLPEQFTLEGDLKIIGSQSKCTNRTLESPNAPKKSSEFKNSEFKNPVTNNKVILQDAALFSEKNKDFNSNEQLAKNAKGQETINNNIPSIRNVVVESKKVAKEVNMHNMPEKEIIVESGAKTKNIVEQNNPKINSSKENKADDSTEELPILSSENQRNIKDNKKDIKENKLDHKIKQNRRKLMKQPTMFKYSVKKLRKLKNLKEQEKTINVDHRRKIENISLKLHNKLIKQGKSTKKTKDSSKTSLLLNKTKLNTQQGEKTVPVFPVKKTVSEIKLNKYQRSKSVPVFPVNKTVSVRNEENKKHIKSKTVETSLPSNNTNLGKQTENSRKVRKVQSEKIKGPPTEVKYSLKQKSKFSNRDLNNHNKNLGFKSLERTSLNAPDYVRKVKIITKRSVQSVNKSNFNKTPKILTAQHESDSITTDKRSRIYSQVTPLSKKSVAPKVSKKINVTNLSPEMSNRIEDNKNRRGKQVDAKFDAKRTKKLSLSKQNRGSKNNLNLELQNNRDRGISSRTPKVPRSKSEPESGAVSIVSPEALKHSDEVFDRNHSKKQNISISSNTETKLHKNKINEMENNSLNNMINSKDTREDIAFENHNEETNSNNSSHSLKLVKSHKKINLTDNHTNKNRSKEVNKTHKPKIKTKQEIINTIWKNTNYNKKRETTQKMVSLRKNASNKMKDETLIKDKNIHNSSKETESLSEKELPEKSLNKNESKSGKQENQTESETVMSITQNEPKLPASPSGYNYQDKSNLKNSKLNDTIRRETKESYAKDKNVTVNLDSDSSFRLSNIKNDVAKKTIVSEKYLKKGVKTKEINTKTDKKDQEDYNIANINYSQLHGAVIKKELSGKLEDEKVICNSNKSKNYKTDKSTQTFFETKELDHITRPHNNTQQNNNGSDNKSKGLRSKYETAVLHTSKVSNKKELIKDGNKTTVLYSTLQTENIPGTPNQQLQNEEKKPQVQYSTIQAINIPKAAIKDSTRKGKPNKVINNTNQSLNTTKSNDSDGINKENMQKLHIITEQKRNMTKEAEQELIISGINTPKVLNNKTQDLKCSKTDSKISDNVISSKKLHSQKFNNNTVNNLTDNDNGLSSVGFNSAGSKESSIKKENFTPTGNEDKNKNSLMKHDLMEKNINTKNNKSVATSKNKMVTYFKPMERFKKDIDVTTLQGTLRVENGELKNDFISKKINHLNKNLNHKFNPKGQPLKKLSSKKSPHVNKGDNEEILKNKQLLIQDPKKTTYTPDRKSYETNSSYGITSKFRGISKTNSHNYKTSNNLKERQNTKKEIIVNNDRDSFSSLHDKNKFNIKINNPNKDEIKTESKGTSTAVSKKEGEKSIIIKSSLIKDKESDVSPKMRRKLSSLSLSAKLNVGESKLSSQMSDHTLERQNSPPHEGKIEENLTKDPFQVKQHGIKDTHDHFLKHLAQIAGFKNDTTQNDLAIDNTNNIVKEGETEQNNPLGTKKTVCETKQNLNEIDKSHFKTSTGHTREKLRLKLGNIKTGISKSHITYNKEVGKKLPEVGKEENKTITFQKANTGNIKEDKKPKPSTLNLKDNKINCNAQPIRVKYNEEDSRLVQIYKNFCSPKAKKLNVNAIKADENLYTAHEEEKILEKYILKNESDAQSIKLIVNSSKNLVKMDSSTKDHLLNLMDKKKIKPILKNEDAEIKTQNKVKKNKVESTKCDSSQINSNQCLKASILEDGEKNSITPKKKERKSFVSFKKENTSD